MKIKKIIDQHQNDFTALMKCEHCGHEQELTNGYKDAYFYEKVIPSIPCNKCGLNRNAKTKGL